MAEEFSLNAMSLIANERTEALSFLFELTSSIAKLFQNYITEMTNQSKLPTSGFIETNKFEKPLSELSEMYSELGFVFSIAEASMLATSTKVAKLKKRFEKELTKKFEELGNTQTARLKARDKYETAWNEQKLVLVKEIKDEKDVERAKNQVKSARKKLIELHKKVLFNGRDAAGLFMFLEKEYWILHRESVIQCYEAVNALETVASQKMTQISESIRIIAEQSGAFVDAISNASGKRRRWVEKYSEATGMPEEEFDPMTETEWMTSSVGLNSGCDETQEELAFVICNLKAGEFGFIAEEILDVVFGEVVVVLDKGEPEENLWWYVEKEGGERGYVPIVCLSLIKEEERLSRLKNYLVD